MRLAVLMLVSPTAHTTGYVRRFLTEWLPGIYVGSVNRSLVDDLVSVLAANTSTGVLIVSSDRAECGYDVLFSNLNERRMCDFDGVPLVEKHPADQ